MYKTLISTSELAVSINDPDFVIVDCRFDLQNKDWGRENYLEHHIPGAVFVDQDQDLCGEITPSSGRHPLPEPADFIKTVRRLGISNSSQVIAYDTAGGGMAGRLWFLLNYYGHQKVALLDGGFPAWIAENRPIVKGQQLNQPSMFSGHPDETMILKTADVKKNLFDHSFSLIDSRAPERYRGEVEPLDPVAGHIPGALNRFYGDNLDKRGLFLPAPEIKAAFLKVLGDNSSDKAAVYCGSGTTACHNYFAMTYAGLPRPKIYIGSWSEWIRDPQNPISTGAS